MTNPVTKSAYTVEQLAEHLGEKKDTLLKKLKRSPECLPPHTIISRESATGGTILFPVTLFEKWCEEKAVHTLNSSHEMSKYPQASQKAQ